MKDSLVATRQYETIISQNVTFKTGKILTGIAVRDTAILSRGTVAGNVIAITARLSKKTAPGVQKLANNYRVIACLGGE